MSNAPDSSPDSPPTSNRPATLDDLEELWIAVKQRIEHRQKDHTERIETIENGMDLFGFNLDAANREIGFLNRKADALHQDDLILEKYTFDVETANRKKYRKLKAGVKSVDAVIKGLYETCDRHDHLIRMNSVAITGMRHQIQELIYQNEHLIENLLSAIRIVEERRARNA